MNYVSTPILLIIWRRPQSLLKLIASLRDLQPAFIYVASDGPRLDNPDEAELVAHSRQLIDSEIDWPCEIHRFYADVNKGCSEGPIASINWFFNHVEAGIILEDDCIPNPDFLIYSSDLLNRYRADRRVWCISGNCYIPPAMAGSSSYYFSRYTLTWGWATWRDRWDDYDAQLRQWPLLRDSGFFPQLFEDPYEAIYWAEIFERTYRRDEPITWWDYQWFFAGLSRGALTATPVRNLVSNIGFGEGATHTLNPDTPIHPALPLGPITHPDFVLRHRDADTYTYAHHFGGIRRRNLRTLQQRIGRRLSRALAWMGLR